MSDVRGLFQKFSYCQTPEYTLQYLQMNSTGCNFMMKQCGPLCKSNTLLPCKRTNTISYTLCIRSQDYWSCGAQNINYWSVYERLDIYHTFACMLHKQYEGYFLTIENESTCTYKNFFYQYETNVNVTYNFEA